MGADFVFAIVKKPDKEKTLAAIDALDEETLRQIAEDVIWGEEPDDPNFTEEVRDFLRNAVGVCETCGESRDVGMVKIEQPGIYLITGGMTWGDDPTDAFKYLWALEAAGLG